MPLFTMTTMISLHMHTAKECRVARVLPSIKILLHLPFSLSHFGGVKGKLVSNSLNCQFAGKFIVEKGFEKYFSSWICHDEEEWSWRESKSNDIYRLDCEGTRCLSLDDFDVDIHNFSPLFCSLQSSIATEKLVWCVDIYFDFNSLVFACELAMGPFLFCFSTCRFCSLSVSRQVVQLQLTEMLRYEMGLME